MIHNMGCTIRTPLEIQLERLHSADFEFYLSGSQFFNTAGPESDWDFFVADKGSIHSWLKGEGFTSISLTRAEKYMGIETQGCTAIYRKTFLSKHIDVQLQANVNRKIKAQKILKEFQEYFTIELNDKRKRKSLWDRAFKLADALDVA